VFPANTIVPANSYLVVYCNSLSAPGPTNTGFHLSAAGDQVYLFKSLALGGGLLDSVAFGQQVPDYSLSRVPDASGPFTLGIPTRGALNAAAGVASISNVKLNEWVTNPMLPNPSWFELYNTASQPVLLSGSFLTDQLTNRTKFGVRPLTYIGTGASRWLQLIADNDSSALPNHVNFALSPGEALGLYNGAGTAVDTVTTSVQAEGSSQGRYVDGASAILTLAPTPGTANQQSILDSDDDGMPDSWELANGLNPNDPNDAQLDKDADGTTNLQEYIAGTDPRSSGSKLGATIERSGSAGQFAIKFIAVAGHTYTVRYKNDLAGTWTRLQDVSAPPANANMTILDTPPAGIQRRFYQVVTPAQP
jgi:hypothetical protein